MLNSFTNRKPKGGKKMSSAISTHVIFTGIYFVLAIVTLLPNAAASKDCLLGYKALCSFTPISTVILVGLGVLHIVLQMRSKKSTSKAA